MSMPNDPGTLYTLDLESLPCDTPDPAPGWSLQVPTTLKRSVNEPAYRIACSPSPTRDGSRSARFHLARGDRDVPRAGSVRTEWAASEPNEPDLQERWYGFSIYLLDWEVDQSAESLTQWHQADFDPPRNETAGSPPLALLTQGDSWRVAVRKRWDSTDRDTDNIVIDKWTANVWTDWVFHVVWRDTDAFDSVTEVWMNGVRKDEFSDGRSGRQNKFADGAGVYTKFGIYKWNWADRDTEVSQRVIYYDALRIADHRGSLAAVSPAARRRRSPRS